MVDGRQARVRERGPWTGTPRGWARERVAKGARPTMDPPEDADTVATELS